MGFYLAPMKLGIQTPVHGRPHVVSTMITIVTHQKIEQFTPKCAGMVVRMGFIAAIVLPVIGAENAPNGVNIGQEQEQKELFPIEIEPEQTPNP